MHRLFDLIRRFARGRHLHPARVGQVSLGQLFHLFGHGGRKQHGLARGAQLGGNFAQRMDEAHVQHLIGLIQHQMFGLGQVHSATVHQVDQTAGGRDQNIGAAVQNGDLAVDRLAAHHGAHVDRGMIGQHVQVVGNLVHQFAGWGQHQCFGGF